MDPHGMQARIDEMMTDFQRMRDGLGDLQRRLQSIRCSASSRDGFVKATVGPRGQLLDLELDPRLYRTPDSKALAASIVATIQEAAAAAVDKVVEAVEPYQPAEDVRAQMDMNFDSYFRRLDNELDLGGGAR